LFGITHHRRLAVVVLTLTLIVVAVIASRLSRITPHVRNTAVGALEDRFKSDVALGSLQVSVFPRPEVTGAALDIRFNNGNQRVPMIRVDAFTASAGLWGLLTSPLRLRTVEVEGLKITLQTGLKRDPNAPAPATRPKSARLHVDEIVARSAQLEIVSRDPGKLPRVFEIHNLVMRDLGDAAGSEFRAALTNPKPHGRIDTEGRFGPWRSDEPRQSPVRGKYEFRAANLNTIKGIGGTLTSTGEYEGVLERIQVKGTTDTPDFSIDVARQPVPLKTRFQAVVDGTNGDTWLEHVEGFWNEQLGAFKAHAERTRRGRRR